MKKTLSEVFTEFTKTPTRSGKIDVIRNNHSRELECVLKYTFHPGISFNLNFIPPYTKSITPEGFAYQSIGQVIDKVYLFDPNHPSYPNLPKKRVDELLIQMLESLELKDAEYFAGMLVKKLPVPGLDYAIVKEAVPTLLP